MTGQVALLGAAEPLPITVPGHAKWSHAAARSGATAHRRDRPDLSDEELLGLAQVRVRVGRGRHLGDAGDGARALPCPPEEGSG